MHGDFEDATLFAAFQGLAKQVAGNDNADTVVWDRDSVRCECRSDAVGEMGAENDFLFR